MEAIFRDKEHRRFYKTMLAKCQNDDCYHKALFYTLGVCPETRKYITHVYNFEENCLNHQGLSEGWQTGSSRKVCALAFNLYNGWEGDENTGPATVDEVMCCGYAPYFFQAVKLRYPEYCREIPSPVRAERG